MKKLYRTEETQSLNKTIKKHSTLILKSGTIVILSRITMSDKGKTFISLCASRRLSGVNATLGAFAVATLWNLYSQDYYAAMNPQELQGGMNDMLDNHLAPLPKNTR